MLLAVTAKPRPWDGFQSRLRDRTVTSLTHPERTVLDPSQRLVDGPQQVTVALAQMDLEERLGLVSRPVGKVPSMSLRSGCGQ